MNKNIPQDDLLARAAMQKHTYAQVSPRGNWVTMVSPTTGYGYFETAKGVEGGGLWFDGNVLTDYDGRACLPKDVGLGLQALGYEVGPEFF